MGRRSDKQVLVLISGKVKGDFLCWIQTLYQIITGGAGYPPKGQTFLPLVILYYSRYITNCALWHWGRVMQKNVHP